MTRRRSYTVGYIIGGLSAASMTCHAKADPSTNHSRIARIAKEGICQ